MRNVTPASLLRAVPKGAWAALLAVAIGAGIWACSFYSFLLFHSIVEIFSIVVAVCVFMVSWNSRGYPEARPLILLGVGYLFVASIDLIHTLSYSGMNVLHEVGDFPTKLWIAARSLQAFTTLAFAAMMRSKKTAPSGLVFFFFGTLTALLFLTIFYWNIFPLCFIEGKGVTTFKKASEYVISAVFAVSIVLVAGEREALGRKVRALLALAFGLTIASELVFTLYVTSSGVENLAGHLLKLASFLLTYQALIVTQVRKRITLIEELERAKEALERGEGELLKANLSKDKFFSIIAHDLRNPMGGLLTLSELIVKNFDGLSSQKIKDFCRLMNEGAAQGMELLESILQWARAHTGRIEYSPRIIGLADLCGRTVEQHGTSAAGKGIGITLSVDAEATTFADDNMLSTILRNLLSNAVKFTPRGGHITLSTRELGDRVELSVADTGVGMSAEDMDKLFRIDAQLSTRGTEEERGNGMGLIICKEFTDLSHGEISVASRVGLGSTFKVLLPKHDPAMFPVPAPGMEGPL